MPINTSSKKLQSGFIQAYHKDESSIHAELIVGLLAPQAYTAAKYLYDALGSRLFEAICEVPEYYPTRTEAGIFAAHLSEIAASVGTDATLIDLGAGNCVKAAQLFPALRPTQYVPVDISVEFLRDAVANLRQRFPEIAMTGVGLDFSSSLALPDAVQAERRLFFYPGSSIGNFAPPDALAFLQRVQHACDADGGLLIGVDLIKDKATLDAAYDDALGVTAAFNLNVLLHLNKILGADFDVRQWQHRGFFNQEKSRIEMHLEAKENIEVCWNGGRRQFVQGQRIHTENSYKYTRDGFIELLQQAGFDAPRIWTDARGWFMVCHAQARR